PGPELLAHHRAHDRVDALARDDAAPEQLADVRAERVDLLLLPVERERVVPAATVHPEARVEGAAQLLGVVLEPVREGSIAPHLPGHLGRSAFGVVDVTLYLAGRDRPLGERPVAEALRVAGVL